MPGQACFAALHHVIWQEKKEQQQQPLRQPGCALLQVLLGISTCLLQGREHIVSSTAALPPCHISGARSIYCTAACIALL